MIVVIGFCVSESKAISFDKESGKVVPANGKRSNGGGSDPSIS